MCPFEYFSTEHEELHIFLFFMPEDYYQPKHYTMPLNTKQKKEKAQLNITHWENYVFSPQKSTLFHD